MIYIFFLIILMPFVAVAQTETKIRKDSLLPTVRNELDKKYNAYSLNNVLKITDKQQNITYKVEVQKNQL